jgi:TonB family protein
MFGVSDLDDRFTLAARTAECSKIEASLASVESTEAHDILRLRDQDTDPTFSEQLAEASRIEARLAAVETEDEHRMFGVPDVDGESKLARRLVETSKIEAKLAKVEAEEEQGWPYSDDPGVIFLINERVSPRSVRWRDSYRWAGLAISILLHILIFSQLLQGSFVSQLVALAREAQARRHRLPDDNTPFYEMVDMPKGKKEKPTKPAPLSDQDRMAHGGVGKPALRPGSEGNTPELRLEPPGGGGQTQVADAGARQDKDSGAHKAAGQGADASNADGSGKDVTKLDQTASADALIMPQGGGGSRGGLDLRALSARGPGALGGSAPKRSGGQVDVGPLSFDSEWYNWGPYAAEMLRRIRYHWDIPELAKMGVGGVVRVRFFIERDGKVTGVVIEQGSGHPPMDFAARDAILNASPLPPLPEDLTGVDHEGVTITFYYNTPVPEGEYSG